MTPETIEDPLPPFDLPGKDWVEPSPSERLGMQSRELKESIRQTYREASQLAASPEMLFSHLIHGHPRWKLSLEVSPGLKEPHLAQIINPKAEKAVAGNWIPRIEAVAYHCPICGWIKGNPPEENYYEPEPLAGSVGTRPYCEICGMPVGPDKPQIHF